MEYLESKHAWVVDREGLLETIVLARNTPIYNIPPLDEDGMPDWSKVEPHMEWVPESYTLQEGEYMVDIPPTHGRMHAGDTGIIKFRWDGAAWIEGATAEEIAAWELEHPDPNKTPEAVRRERDRLLQAVDMTQLLDAPIDAESREAMRAYRQALRDIPEQPGFPGDVAWPELPGLTKAAPDPVDAAFDIMTGGNTNA